MIASLCFALLGIGHAADNGVVSKASAYSVTDTVARLEAALKAKGVMVFAKIDHSGEAEKAGLKMLPTQLLLFGNPKAGTPLMTAAPLSAIDLPLKALVWQDAESKIWLSYNSAAYLKQRHDLPEAAMKPVAGAIELIEQAVR